MGDRLNPFQTGAFQKQGLFRRLVGRPNPENAYIAIQNLLAERDWETLHEGYIDDALRTHAVKEVDREKLKAIFSKAVEHFASDLNIDDEEVAAIERLRTLLGITDSELGEIEERVIHTHYHRAVADVLGDRNIDASERASVERLVKALRIKERTALKILEDHASPILNASWNAALADGRLSDQETHALEAMAKNFGANLTFDLSTRERIERFRKFWLIENGRFPVISAPINLQRHEQCHYAEPATLFEIRTETKSIRYAGPSFRIKIMKGFYYRAGSAQVQRITQEVMREIDSGTLYFTSKRVIFTGARANKTVTFRSILGLTPFADAIEIEKTSGRNPIYRVFDAEGAAVMLSSLLAHS